MMKKYICHVCGYAELDEAPWGETGKIPSHNICDCCGIQYGYEDCTNEAIRQYRQNWIESGGEWFDETKKPDNWSITEQLRNINI